MEYPGAFYHVFNRGNRREKIYRDSEDYETFEQYLIEAAEWSGVELFAWCLMPNHFHLLLETPDGNLSQFMRRLKTRYAKHFNQIYRLVGHVFQGRYRAILCDKESYLLELVRYIHLNPLKVKTGSLCKSPEEWSWSSHRHYLRGQGPSILKRGMGQVLSRFGGDITGAVQRYQQFVAEGLSGSPWEKQYRIATVSHCGNDAFIKDAWERAEKSPPDSSGKKMTPESLARLMLPMFEIGEPELLSDSRRRQVSLLRQVLIHVGKQDYRLSNVSLAGYLGKDPSMVSQILRRSASQSEIQDKIEQVRKALSS